MKGASASRAAESSKLAAQTAMVPKGLSMKPIIWLAGSLVLLAMGAGAFIWSGAYNIAADEPHWAVTKSMLETARDRSIESRIAGITVPDLDGESMIRAGAGNYDAMCATCHLEPGEDHSELSKGLYPAPPNLARRGIDDPAEAYWTIKHGIKMTGMAAWGKSMDDDSIWGMVAFLRQLPKMSKASYHELVEKSGGHSHGSRDDDHHEHKEN
jgi:mono/diheme cytochrome c family protein